MAVNDSETLSLQSRRRTEFLSSTPLLNCGKPPLIFHLKTILQAPLWDLRGKEGSMVINPWFNVRASMMDSNWLVSWLTELSLKGGSYEMRFRCQKSLGIIWRKKLESQTQKNVGVQLLHKNYSLNVFSERIKKKLLSPKLVQCRKNQCH